MKVFIVSLIILFVGGNYLYTPNTIGLNPTKHNFISKQKLFDEAINYLKKSEGFSNSIYRCPGGKLTIGFGHQVLICSKKIITLKEGEELLTSDFLYFKNYIEKDLNNLKLSENQIIGLSLFTFNVGITNYKKSTLRKMVLAQVKIDKEIIKWCHIKGKVNSSLLKRREFELELYNKNLTIFN